MKSNNEKLKKSNEFKENLSQIEKYSNTLSKYLKYLSNPSSYGHMIDLAYTYKYARMSDKVHFDATILILLITIYLLWSSKVR